MENLYIKFIEWNRDSLNKACDEAKRLGYKKLYKPNTLKFEGQEETFEPWEQIAVSQNSKEDAIKDLKIDRCKYFYIWKNRDWKYVAEIWTWDSDYNDFKFIAKIPQVKKRKIKCTDDQFEEIKKILNNK